MKHFILSFILLLIVSSAIAQRTYRSNAPTSPGVPLEWSTPTSWTCNSSPCGIPTLNDSVIIQTGHYITLSTSIPANGFGKDIVINGQLDLTTNNRQLWVNGNLTINGQLNAGNGLVLFRNPTVPINHTISGSVVSTFNDIQVNSGTTVLVESSQNIRGNLHLASSTSIFDADGSTNTSIFTLLSSSDTFTSSITGFGQTLGNVTIQRYMSIEGTDGRLYRYISSPVKNPKVSQIQATIPITGSFTGTSLCSGCGSAASMYYYNEAVPGHYQNGYVEFPDLSNQETLTTGLGYAIFVRGNKVPIVVAGNAKWSVTGEVNNDYVEFPITFTSSGVIVNDGWNLIGNPYPSAIDWIDFDKSSVDNAIYTTNNESGQTQYATFVDGVGTNRGSRYIALGQGFWIKANSDNPFLGLSIGSSGKNNQTAEFFRKKDNDEEKPLTNLLYTTLLKGTLSDETAIRFKDSTTVDFDSHADAYKLANSTHNISTFTSDGKTKLAINSVGNDTLVTVRYNVSEVVAGTYDLKFDSTNTFDPTTEIRLYDAFTDSTHNVMTSKVYTFAVTSDTASFGANRFSITFRRPPQLITGIETTEGTRTFVYPNPATDRVTIKSDNKITDIKIISTSGVVLGKYNEKVIDLSSYTPNLYILSFREGTTVRRIKIVKK